MCLTLRQKYIMICSILKLLLGQFAQLLLLQTLFTQGRECLSKLLDTHIFVSSLCIWQYMQLQYNHCSLYLQGIPNIHITRQQWTFNSACTREPQLPRPLLVPVLLSSSEGMVQYLQNPAANPLQETLRLSHCNDVKLAVHLLLLEIAVPRMAQQSRPLH